MRRAVRLRPRLRARPARPALDGLEPKSVKKKLKQPSFAAGVHRDEVYAGAELLELDLDEHIRNVVAALQPIAAELGLRTAADAPVPASPFRPAPSGPAADHPPGPTLSGSPHTMVTRVSETS